MMMRKKQPIRRRIVLRKALQHPFVLSAFSWFALNLWVSYQFLQEENSSSSLLSVNDSSPLRSRLGQNPSDILKERNATEFADTNHKSHVRSEARLLLSENPDIWSEKNIEGTSNQTVQKIDIPKDQGWNNQKSFQDTTIQNNATKSSLRGNTTKRSIHIKITNPKFTSEKKLAFREWLPAKDPTLPYPYWNLSCPLEMSTFSAVHIGEDNFVQRAQKSLYVAKKALDSIQKGLWSSSPPAGMGQKRSPRRIFFVGDSLLRQTFISLACHSEMVDYSVVWYTTMFARANFPNTFSMGPHSKFQEARVWLKDGTELIFHHGIGGMLFLSDDYVAQDPPFHFLNACRNETPFTTHVLARGHLYTDRNAKREVIELRKDDIIIMNGSVHNMRLTSLQNMAGLVKCMKEKPEITQSMWPQLVYMVTGAQHFPTDSGAFEIELMNRTNYQCRQKVTIRSRYIEERQILRDQIPILGAELLDLEMRAGHLHVGGVDCLHWIMPGIPDLMVASLMNFTRSLS